MSDSNREWGENSDEAIHRRRVLLFVNKHKEIGPLDDGFQYFFANGRGGFSAVDLRIIADELDARNRNWQAQIERDLS
jgi:hypothetical protein